MLPSGTVSLACSKIVCRIYTSAQGGTVVGFFYGGFPDRCYGSRFAWAYVMMDWLSGGVGRKRN